MKNRLYCLTLLQAKRFFDLELCSGAKFGIAVHATVDAGNHLALAFQTGMSRDMSANIQELSSDNLRLIVATKLGEAQLAPSVTQSFCEKLMVLRYGLALEEMFLRMVERRCRNSLLRFSDPAAQLRLMLQFCELSVFFDRDSAHLQSVNFCSAN